MSNRRRPRSPRRQQYVLGQPDLAYAYATGWSCPDCHSESGGLTEPDEHGIRHVVIRHDTGCPYLAGVTR